MRFRLNSSRIEICRSLCLMVFLAACCLMVDGSWAEEPVDAARIKQWIVGLDDDLYDSREKSQQQLEQVGITALDAVAQESREGSLESSTRAINILLTWSESEDRKLRIAALEKLISLQNRPNESRAANELLADAHEEEALEAIVELGGYHTIPPRTRTGRFSRQQLPPQVVIGVDWKGGAEGLRHLAKVRRATILSFHSAPVDDSVVEILANFNSIRRFEFYGTSGVSEEATKKMKKLFPGRVFVRSAARLGIQGEFGTAKVVSVVKDSAADKAGLKRNDHIVEFNGEKVQDFDVLTKRIAKHQPGDSVELTVVRNREVQKIKVTFDQWGRGDMQLRKEEGDQGEEEKPQPPAPIRLDRR